jgi:hypothetical protein
MPIVSHTKAAEDHTAAAAAHQAAAELHGQGDHAAALEKSTKAHSCCCSADKSTADAHKMSAAKART